MLLVPFGVPRLDLVDACGLGRDTAPQALTTPMAEFALRHVEPTAMCGRVMDVEFIGDAFCLRRIKGFIPRSFAVGLEIVQNSTDLLRMGIMLVNEYWDKVSPIHLGARISYLGLALTCSWLKSEQPIGRTISLLLGSISAWFPRLGWHRRTDCANQLGRHCLPTHVRTLGIVWFFIPS